MPKGAIAMEIFERFFLFIKHEYDVALQNGQVLGFFTTVAGIIAIPATVVAFFKFLFRPLITLIAPSKEMKRLWEQLVVDVELDIVQNESEIQKCLRKYYSIVDKRHYTKKQKVAIKSDLKAWLGWINFGVQLKACKGDISRIDYQKVIDYFEEALNFFSEGFNKKSIKKIIFYKSIYIDIFVGRLKALWTMGDFEKGRMECESLVEELGLQLPKEEKRLVYGVVSEHYKLLSFFWSCKFDDIYYGIDKARDLQGKIRAYEQLKNDICTNQLSELFVSSMQYKLYRFAKFQLRDEETQEKLFQILLVFIECSIELYRHESTWANQDDSRRLIENFKSFIQKNKLSSNEISRELALFEAKLNYYSFLNWRYDNSYLETAHNLLWEAIKPKHTLEIATEYELYSHYGFFGLCLKEEGKEDEAETYLAKAYDLAKSHYGEKFYKTIFWENAFVLMAI